MIELDLNVNKKRTSGTHDSGCNFTVINEKLTKPHKINVLPDSSVYKSSSGISMCKGRAKILMKIGEIEQNMKVAVKDKNAMDHNILLGTDALKKFKLILDENLRVYQNINGNKVALLTNIQKTDDISHKDVVNKLNSEHYMNHLEPHKKKKLIEIIIRNIESIAKSKYDIGKATIDECKIKLIDENNITSEKPYRTDIVYQKKIDNTIDNLLTNNLINESYSPFSAPIALVDKKDDGYKTRLVVNYKK